MRIAGANDIPPAQLSLWRIAMRSSESGPGMSAIRPSAKTLRDSAAPAKRGIWLGGGGGRSLAIHGSTAPPQCRGIERCGRTPLGVLLAVR